MKAFDTYIQGLYVITSDTTSDTRGKLNKYFSGSIYYDLSAELNFVESFYSTSKRNVIRGMHFQVPPFDHVKLVHVIRGGVLDVVVDVRKLSPTYGQFYAHILREPDGQAASSMLIDKGLAHGFLSLMDDTIMHYSTTTEYNPGWDMGIRYDSFGFDWKVHDPVISLRDLGFPGLAEI